MEPTEIPQYFLLLLQLVAGAEVLLVILVVPADQVVVALEPQQEVAMAVLEPIIKVVLVAMEAQTVQVVAAEVVRMRLELLGIIRLETSARVVMAFHPVLLVHPYPVAVAVAVRLAIVPL
jgi:hypothetical protein